MTIAASQLLPRQFRRAGAVEAGLRQVAEETPVAISYDGTTFAVMMASPSDVEDFAIGFTLTEGIVQSLAGIENVTVVEHGGGIEAQVRLASLPGRELQARRRRIAGPVGCGLCGIDSIEAALRPAAFVGGLALKLDASSVSEAVAALAKRQPLNTLTRAVHAAGLWTHEDGMAVVREDVGRHNALDKLVGALAKAERRASEGAVVLTSRVSVEMVQKTAAAGCGLILAVSAPTALAVRMAEAAGITLAAVVRGAEFEVFCGADRIILPGVADVA